MKPNNEENRSEKDKKGRLYRREIDTALWKEVQELAKGSEEERMKCIKIIFDNYYQLPEEVNNLMKELVLPNQPEQLRIAVAKRLSEKPHISFGLYSNLIEILAKDTSPQVKSVIDVELKRMQELMKPIIEMAKKYQEQMTNAIRVLSKVKIPQLLIPQRLIENIASMNRVSEEIIRTMSSLTLSYYPPAQLQVIDEVKAPITPNPLIQRLRNCPSGKEHWKEYQDICVDILEHTLCPPLMPPEEERPTGTGLHRRDIIMHIPLDAPLFWYSLRLAYSALAIIVECKNYRNEIPANDVVISSKYFGKKKLSLFGIILTRKGLDGGARKQQRSLWQNEDKMIICLNDADLEKMVLLQDSGEDPSVVIDKAIRDLRASLE